MTYYYFVMRVLLVYAALVASAVGLATGALSANEWDRVEVESSTMPSARQMHSLVHCATGLVLYGGQHVASPSGAEAMDRGEASLAALGDLWYGVTSENATDDLEQVRWKELFPIGETLPWPRYGHSAVSCAVDVFTTYVVVFGGLVNGTRATDETWALIPQKDGEPWLWSLMDVSPSAPSARAYHSAVGSAEASSMMLFGGLLANGTLANDTYLLSFYDMSWTRVPHDDTSPSPPARAKHAAAVLGYTAYVYSGCCGGASGTEILTDLWSFSFRTLHWELLDDGSQPVFSPIGRVLASMVAFGSKLVLIGGQSGTNLDSNKGHAGDLDDVWTFSLKSTQPHPWMRLHTSGSAFRAVSGLATLTQDRVVSTTSAGAAASVPLVFANGGSSLNGSLILLPGCNPGSVSSDFLLSTCTPCDRGSFASYAGMVNCTACPAGSTTHRPGAQSLDQCNLCAPGYDDLCHGHGACSIVNVHTSERRCSCHFGYLKTDGCHTPWVFIAIGSLIFVILLIAVSIAVTVRVRDARVTYTSLVKTSGSEIAAYTSNFLITDEDLHIIEENVRVPTDTDARSLTGGGTNTTAGSSSSYAPLEMDGGVVVRQLRGRWQGMAVLVVQLTNVKPFASPSLLVARSRPLVMSGGDAMPVVDPRLLAASGGSSSVGGGSGGGGGGGGGSSGGSSSTALMAAAQRRKRRREEKRRRRLEREKKLKRRQQERQESESAGLLLPEDDQSMIESEGQNDYGYDDDDEDYNYDAGSFAGSVNGRIVRAGLDEGSVLYQPSFLNETAEDEADDVDASRRDLLVRTIAEMRRLRHENLVVCFGGGLSRAQCVPFFVLEFSPLGSLLSSVRCNELTRRSYLRRAQEVLRALEFLHEQQQPPVVHGAVCCANVLLFSSTRGEPHAKLFAPGLSYLVRSLQRMSLEVSFTGGDVPVGDAAGGSSGSTHLLPWLAPEALSCGASHPSADMYSFGVALWEVYSGGERPYASFYDDETGICEHVRGGGRPAPPTGLDRRVRDLLCRCWDARWIERPHAHEIHMMLEELLEDDEDGDDEEEDDLYTR